MVQESEIMRFFKKNRKRIFRYVVLLWVFFALIIFLEDEIASRITGSVKDPGSNLQYSIRWVLWSGFTLLIIYLAAKFPITRENLVTGIATHFSFALFIITVEFCIEVPVARWVTQEIYGKSPPFIDYAKVLVFKLNTYLLLYFLIVGITYLVLYIESHQHSKIMAKNADLKNQQLHSQLAEAKLNLLKMQLDPHFLFNTHHSIISLMLNNENEKAIRMLTMLSDLLRLSLENQQQTIPLETEIQLVKLYLDIQQIRFNDRMNVKFNIDPGALSKNVPSFILQPLVENAIKHGVAVSSSAGRISIDGKLAGNELMIKVENGGTVLYPGNISEGIGISNTRQRLNQLYNGRSSFSLQNTGHDSVAALITIPIN